MYFKKIIGFTAIIFLISISSFVLYKSQKKTVQRAPQLEAVIQKIISAELKSPGSAQFVELIIEKQVDPENAYYVLGDVDSQNGFGALLRTHFFLKIIDQGGDKQNVDNWIINELILDNVAYISEGKTYERPLTLDGELLTLQKHFESQIRESK